MRDHDHLGTALLNLGRYSGFNELNFALGDSITRNERRIQANAERMNQQFGLHMKKPKLVAAVEFEFLSDMHTKELLDMETWGDHYRGIPRQSFGELLEQLDLELTLESSGKKVDGKPFNKYEIRAKKPTSISEQLTNYSSILTMVPVTRYHLRRFSHHVNFSIQDEANPTSCPYNNKAFRDLIGNNVTKFLDEALVLMDTKSSIAGYNALGDREATDRMNYLPTNSKHDRCYYQVAYRNDDKPLDDYSDDVTGTSTARHELRRTYPGPSSHSINVCDPVLSACALVTAATAYSFEKGIKQELQEYRYRGTDYNFHMEKFENSRLLNEYWGEPLLKDLVNRAKAYNIDAEFNSLLIPRDREL